MADETNAVTMTVAEAEAALAAARAAEAAQAEAAAAEAAAQREARATELQSQIGTLDTQISELEAQRSTLTKELRGLTGRKGRKGSGRRGRPAGSKNKATRAPKAASEAAGRSSANSLRHFVASALTDKPQSATQIVDAVKAAGYETDSENFPTMVAQNLVKLITLRCGNANVANRPERGMYVAGSGMAAYLADPSSAVEKE
jgi:multidrug efflux pump subunit AcrA (membrane-fusion protein)